MENEIKAAAKWWRDILASGAKQDAGDGFLNAAMTALTKDAPWQKALTTEQLDGFESRLCVALKAHFEKCWNPKDPLWGSYVRNIYNDYHPADILRMCAQPLGIHDQCFPIKTSMYIDPGSVRVKYGYGAPEQVIYTEAK